MQQRLDFDLIENHQLLYDELFAAIKLVIAGDTKQSHLDFIRSIDISSAELTTFETVLRRREELLDRTSQNSANETLYRQRLITPLLTELLGYELESLDPEEFVRSFGHIDDFYRWQTRYLPIESKQYGRLQKDRLTVHKQSNADPIWQITNYLRGTNWKLFKSKQTEIDAPYAILTDGLEWRLYQYDHLDNEQSPPCLIIRLDRVDLTDKRELTRSCQLLMLFFSEQATRRGGWLDQIFDENHKRSLAIQKNLGEQVFEAAEYIANGIYLKISRRDKKKKESTISHYQQHFPGYADDKDTWFRTVLYHESLVYLFRIIFGLYGEDRGLLDAVKIDYGLKQGERNLLIDIERKFGNQHGGEDRKTNQHHIDFFDNEDRKLETFYFQRIDQKYNGGLFDPQRHPLLADFDINDRYFLRAIDFLLRTQDPHDQHQLATISYAQLDVRHLGTIYENLLEFSLQPNADSSADILPLKLVNDKGERKATGSYYTPDYIVTYIVQQTVGTKLDEIIGDKLPTSKSDIKKVCDQILELNVCDPAMGSGHFLIEVVSTIHTRISELISQLPDDQQASLTQRYSLSEIASRCIYGVDINYLAVELAKVVIWIKTFDPETPLQFLDANLKWGNSLIGTRVDDLFASDKMQQLNQLFQDMGWAETKAKQAISEIGKTIHAYIAGASDASTDMETQKQQVQLKYHLFKMLSYRLYEQVKKIPDRLGDNLSGLQGLSYKEQSKRKVAHIQAQWQEIQDQYGELNPFADWRSLRKFFQIGLASFNAKYLLTVPLALEFVPESRDAINLGYESQVRQMLGGEKTTTLNMDTMHLPSDRYRGDGVSVTKAVDRVMQEINPFHREVEFPHVFAKGGFDCVVGNPPYVSYYSRQSQGNAQTAKEIIFYKGHYDFVVDRSKKGGRYNTVMFFLELSTKILSKGGLYGLIVDNNIHSNPFLAIRKYLLNSSSLHIIVDNLNAFENVASGQVILVGSNSLVELASHVIKYYNLTEETHNLLDSIMLSNLLKKKDLSIKYQPRNPIVEKLKNQEIMEDVFGKNSILCGISFTGKKEEFVSNTQSEKNDLYELLEGSKGVSGPYCIATPTAYLKYDLALVEKLNEEYKIEAESKGIRSPKTIYFPPRIDYFEGPKLFVRLSDTRITATFTDDLLCNDLSLYRVKLSSPFDTNSTIKFLLTILNSRLMTYYFIQNGWIRNLGVGTPQIRIKDLRKLPIKLPDDQTPFVDKADQMLALHRDQHEIISGAHRLLLRRCEVGKLSRKLENFWELEFADFLSELGKKNKSLKKIPLAEEEKREARFLDKQKAILDYQQQIDTLDAQIDQMVYELYGLTEDEKATVIEEATRG